MDCPECVCIVSLSNAVSFGAVAKVSMAIQKQVTRDFAPVWGIQAIIGCAEKLEDVPTDAWVVMIVDGRDGRLPEDAGGLHLDEQGQPFALVRDTEDWELTTSHEVLEMLVDPFGNRLIAGESPAVGQGRVNFLVEVCDPSEAKEFGYTVNGILLSDFYTPHYFDPVANAGVKYSYSGKITKPRTVLPGGYLSWHDPVSDSWFQWRYFGSSQVVSLGKLAMQGSVRAAIERKTNGIMQREMNRSTPPAVATSQASLMMSRRVAAEESTSAKAKSLKRQLDAIMTK